MQPCCENCFSIQMKLYFKQKNMIAVQLPYNKFFIIASFANNDLPLTPTE